MLIESFAENALQAEISFFLLISKPQWMRCRMARKEVVRKMNFGGEGGGESVNGLVIVK